jgi:hypothetical protein
MFGLGEPEPQLGDEVGGRPQLGIGPELWPFPAGRPQDGARGRED